MRRDANTMFANDHFGVAFDSFYDRRNGYGMFANSLGGMLDWSITNEQPNNSWNGIWDVRTGEFDGGWTVEFRFPFRSFRFREGGTIWGLEPPAPRQLEERDVVSGAGAGLVGTPGDVAHVGGGDGRGTRRCPASSGTST